MLRYLTPVIILAPDTYLARFDTSVGIFIVRVTRAWAPHGADRFYNLVKRGFYDQCRFFRLDYIKTARLIAAGN